MSFDEFKTLCNRAPTSTPCPLIVGDETAPVHSSIGDTPFHQLVIFRMKPDDDAMKAIHAAVRFSFAATENAVAITPL